MNKREFLEALAEQLAPLREFERKQALAFYEELIDDCTKGDASEEEFIAGLDPLSEIAGEFLRGAAKQRRRWWNALWMRRASAGRELSAPKSIWSRQS